MSDSIKVYVQDHVNLRKVKKYFHDEWPKLAKDLNFEQQNYQYGLISGFVRYELDNGGWYHYVDNAPHSIFLNRWVPIFEEATSLKLDHGNGVINCILTKNEMHLLDKFVIQCQYHDHEVISSLIPVFTYAREHGKGISISG